MEGAFLLEVSRRIKEKRIEKKMTLQELADKSSVSKGLISQIENGRSIPSLPVMFSIIQSLEMDVGDFFKDLNLVEPTIILQKKNITKRSKKKTPKVSPIKEYLRKASWLQQLILYCLSCCLIPTGRRFIRRLLNLNIF